jgi:hypothetical protein
VTWVLCNLALVHLETVLQSVRDRCMVLDTPDSTPS